MDYVVVLTVVFVVAVIIVIIYHLNKMKRMADEKKGTGPSFNEWLAETGRIPAGHGYDDDRYSDEMSADDRAWEAHSRDRKFRGDLPMDAYGREYQGEPRKSEGRGQGEGEKERKGPFGLGKGTTFDDAKYQDSSRADGGVRYGIRTHGSPEEPMDDHSYRESKPPRREEPRSRYYRPGDGRSRREEPARQEQRPPERYSPRQDPWREDQRTDRGSGHDQRGYSRDDRRRDSAPPRGGRHDRPAGPQMERCPACSVANRSDARRCSACGKQL